MDTLLRMSDISPLGTLAFVLEEESLLVRVSEGWQYVAVSENFPYLLQCSETLRRKCLKSTLMHSIQFFAN